MWSSGSGFGALGVPNSDTKFNFLILIDIPKGWVTFLCCAEDLTLLYPANCGSLEVDFTPLLRRSC